MLVLVIQTSRESCISKVTPLGAMHAANSSHFLHLLQCDALAS